MSNRKSESDSLTLSFMSDTHELHREIDSLPGGDVLVHAGDFSMLSRSYTAIQDFARWFGAQPYRYKVLTFGNHEFYFEENVARRRIFEQEGVLVLIDEGVTLDGLHIWASPTTPLFAGAFGLCSSVDRKRHWTKIPSGIDVLVTHGPPFGILDQLPGHLEHLGDPELIEAVRLVRPRIHAFGHVHGAYGRAEHKGTTFLNASLLGTGGELEYQPVTMHLPRFKPETPVNRSGRSPAGD